MPDLRIAGGLTPALSFDKTSGTGNSSVKISATAITGRTSRTSGFKIKSTKDTSKEVTVSVTQTAKPEFITGVTTSATIGASETSRTLTFNSNSKYIVLKPSANLKDFSLAVNLQPNASTVLPKPTKNSDGSYTYEVTGDIGSEREFLGQVPFVANINESISVITYTIEVAVTSATKPTTFAAVTDASKKITLRLSHSAKIVTLSVSPTSITIPAAGTAQTVTITSNDAWTIS